MSRCLAVVQARQCITFSYMVSPYMYPRHVLARLDAGDAEQHVAAIGSVTYRSSENSDLFCRWPASTSCVTRRTYLGDASIRSPIGSHKSSAKSCTSYGLLCFLCHSKAVSAQLAVLRNMLRCAEASHIILLSCWPGTGVTRVPLQPQYNSIISRK